MMLGLPVHRRRARYRRHRVLQFGRAVGGAAHFAVVAVLIQRTAPGTFALDEAVRQEQVFHRVVQLRNRLDFDQAGFLQAQIDG